MNGAPFPQLPSPSPGTRFGVYQLIRELGSGGTGRVFAARQPGLQREVALKIADHGGFVDEHAVRRAQREARLLAELAHPGIVRVLDAGVADGAPWLAMELVPGCSLAAVLTRARALGPRRVTASTLWDEVRAGAGRDEPAPTSTEVRSDYVATIVALGVEVADALAYAHAAGVVHRDVKPGNVLIHVDGHARLVDFGGATTSAPDATSHGALGTPGYIAPELASGAVGDHRSDVFALGATLFEALTLQLPFDGRTQHEVASNQRRSAAKDARAIVPSLSPELAAVLAKALARDPEHRYASAGDFGADLRALLVGQPPQARPHGRVRRAVTMMRRRPWLFAGIGVLLGGAVALWLSDRNHSHRVVAAGQRAQAALAKRDRLALRVQLERTRERGAEFIPLRSHQLPAARAWLTQQAEPLADELAALEAELGELRRQALPRTEEDVRRDASRLGLTEPLTALERELAMHQRLLAAGQSEGGKSEGRAAALQATRVEIDALLTTNRGFRFENDEQQLLHDQLAQLVTELKSFAAGHESMLQEVRDHIAALAAGQQRSLEAAAPTWRQAAADIAADPRFVGFELMPRPELLPIRRDPTTRLWEFVFWRAGAPGREVPEVAPDGRYLLTPDHAPILVLVPGGTFAMGAQSADPRGANHDPDASAWEGPVRQVTIGPFFCGKFELSEAQLVRLAKNRVHKVREQQGEQAEKPPLDPATQLSQRRAKQLLERYGLRLPTEAQWEYACRAGSSTAFHFENRQEAANYGNFADATQARTRSRVTSDPSIDDGYPMVAPIGRFAPNALGLHDMHGNVAEMVADTTGSYLRAASGRDGRTPPGWGTQSVTARGGSFAHHPSVARSSNRSLTESPDFKAANLGLRIVLPVEQ